MIQYPAIVNPTPTITRTISSIYVTQEYQLFISLPQTYSDSKRTFPVLYLLDGNLTYTLVRPIVELQQILQRVPDLIIVGIGYPRESYLETASLRGRDLTPIELTPAQKAGTSYPFEDTGGASHFLSCVTHELIPFIDANFRTEPNDRALAGYSLSATFVLYAMFQQPVFFKHMIAISPGISDILDSENEYAKLHSSLPLKLFLGVESRSDDPETLKSIELAQHFVKVIGERKYEGLETKLHIFEGTDHVSVGPIAFTYALREIY